MAGRFINGKKFITIFVLYFIVQGGICGMAFGFTYATGFEGGGGDTGGVVVGCDVNARTRLCGTPAGSGGGGASWRIFKVDDGKGLDDYTGYGGNILQASKKEDAMITCRDYGWFASFGWDGMKGSYYKYSDYNFQIGPANRDGLIAGADYNSYNAHDLNYLKAYNFPNNTKIWPETALDLYKQMYPDKEITAIPSWIGYFCVSADHKITVYAKVNNNGPGYTAGDYLNGGNPIYGPVEGVEHGASVDVKSSDYNPAGYTFANWGVLDEHMAEYTNQTSNTVRDFSWKSLTEDRVLDAYYWKDTFMGQSRVGPSASNYVKSAPSDGWLKTGSAKATWNIDNCDKDSGCTAVIQHALKRQYGGGSTKYHITRVSNMSGISTGTVVGETTEDFNGIADDTAKQVRQTSYTLKPGQYVCETMSFDSDIDTTDVNTTVCATAFGVYETESSDGAFLEINVKKKTDEGEESGWSKEVYVKPTDTIIYQAIYRPQAQKAYSIIPQKLQVNGSTVYPVGYDDDNILQNTGQMMWLYAGATWNNGFRLYSENFLNGAYTNNYTYKLGDADTKIETKDHPLSHGDEVGRSLNNAVVTNLDKIDGNAGGVQVVPRSVSFYEVCQTGTRDGRTVENCYNAGNVDTTPMTDIAYARVPYNFINTTRITSCNAEDAARYGMNCADYTKPAQSLTFYAGETATVHFDTIVQPRFNSATNGTYATIVPQAKMKLVFCIGTDECDNNRYGGDNRETEPSANDGTILALNKATLNNANFNGTENNPESKSIAFNIPDVAAGTKMCVKSAVYPANSGLETNWSDIRGSDDWSYSDPVCFAVAKKPNIQVWGGNVYTRGSIKSSVAQKGNLAGFNDYKINGRYNKRYYFGSWGELGVISGSGVKLFGSGASMGYGVNDNGVLTPNPLGGANNNNPLAASVGGSTIASFCIRSPLTFANFPCSSAASLGSLGSTAPIDRAASDKDAVVTKYVSSDDNKVSGVVVLNNKEKIKEENTYFYDGGDNSLTLGANVVAKSTIQTVYSAKDITINGDLIYEDVYGKYSEMPKLVIYAKQNINISCNVNRIDALLIAGDTVKTCADSDDVDAKANSRQLIINGAVIANKVDLKRTYGAATGANSVIPAEIINFDPSLYMWGEDVKVSEGDDENSEINTMDVVYHRELAPRL